MQILRKTLFAVCISMLSAGLFAQSVDDVGAKFNEGLEAMKAKQYATAVTAFEAAIKLANTVGAGASDLKDNSMKQLVDAYYRNGVTMYKSKKYDGAVAEFDKGIKMAKQTGDSEMEEKLVVVSAKVLSSKGLSLIKDNDLDGAYTAFDQAHQVKPTCVISYYGKGLVWKERGDYNKMMAAMDKAIELAASEPKMSKYSDKAKSASSKALVAAATEEINKEHGAEAAKLITDSFKYEQGDADTYYYLTVAYNKSKSFAKAEEAANTALSLKQGDKSSIFFQLGQSLEGQGNSSGACDAYRQVTSGPNVDAAKYQITQVLGCG